MKLYIYISVVIWNRALAQWVSSLDTFFITDEELIMKLYCQYYEIKSCRVFSEHAQMVHISEDSEFTDQTLQTKLKTLLHLGKRR